jgi:hypothetical protein
MSRARQCPVLRRQAQWPGFWWKPGREFGIFGGRRFFEVRRIAGLPFAGLTIDVGVSTSEFRGMRRHEARRDLIYRAAFKPIDDGLLIHSEEGIN